MPVPQIRMPRSARPSLDGLRHLEGVIRVIDAFADLGAEVEHLVPQLLQQRP